MRDWQQKAPGKNNLHRCQCRINPFVINCSLMKTSMEIECFLPFFNLKTIGKIKTKSLQIYTKRLTCGIKGHRIPLPNKGASG